MKLSRHELIIGSLALLLAVESRLFYRTRNHVISFATVKGALHIQNFNDILIGALPISASEH
jgi:hypothetical protein